MSNKKCTQCGFPNWATAETCKKCQSSLSASAPSTGGDFYQKPLPSPPSPVQKPSGFQILKNDMLSCLAALLPVVMWGVYIAINFFGVSFKSRRSGTVLNEANGGNPGILIASVVITIGCAALIAWRISSISKFFETGERVIGNIIDISFFKDRGRIEYTYSYQRQNFQSGAAIMKNSKTQSYRSGDDVVLIVDPKNPNKALIEDLYV